MPAFFCSWHWWTPQLEVALSGSLGVVLYGCAVSVVQLCRAPDGWSQLLLAPSLRAWSVLGLDIARIAFAQIAAFVVCAVLPHNRAEETWSLWREIFHETTFQASCIAVALAVSKSLALCTRPPSIATSTTKITTARAGQFNTLTTGQPKPRAEPTASSSGTAAKLLGLAQRTRDAVKPALQFGKYAPDITDSKSVSPIAPRHRSILLKPRSFFRPAAPRIHWWLLQTLVWSCCLIAPSVVFQTTGLVPPPRLPDVSATAPHPLCPSEKHRNHSALESTFQMYDVLLLVHMVVSVVYAAVVDRLHAYRNPCYATTPLPPIHRTSSLNLWGNLPSNSNSDGDEETPPAVKPTMIF